MDRYRIWGVKASQQDEQNRGVDSSQQPQGEEEVIYDTSDLEEAQKIMNRGGFIKGDVFHVAMRLEDVEAANAS